MMYDSRAYVINMDRHADRLSLIQHKYDASDVRSELGALRRVRAIDGTMADWTPVVHPDSLGPLQRVSRTGKRIAHEELTPGAVGCYLSHLAVWTEFLRSHKSRALVFEDDADIKPDTMSRMMTCIAELPDDWDLLLLGWENTGQSVPHGHHTSRVTGFARTHAYVISDRCARRLLPAMLPMKVQVDWAITSMIPIWDLKVFGASPCVTNVSFQGTSIQTPFESADDTTGSG